MLKRLYVHNFRCLENFTFELNSNSALLIGNNGAGKSTIMKALQVLQNIGRGINQVGALINKTDFTLGHTDKLLRIEVDVELNQQLFCYSLAFELPQNFSQPRVAEEKLLLDGQEIYRRQQGDVALFREQTSPIEFIIDWHLVALSVIQGSAASPLRIFLEWLSKIILLAPIPALISGYVEDNSLLPNSDGKNLAAWLAGLLAEYPRAFNNIFSYVQEIIPDLNDFRFERIGREAKIFLVCFGEGQHTHEIDFEFLSDGEKCFFLCAAVLAANACYGPLFVFWDEPDNFLAPHEVGHFILALRRGFHARGQIVMTSHHQETIQRFSHENTWVLGRKSHLEPTLIRLLGDLPSAANNVIQALLEGELEP